MDDHVSDIPLSLKEDINNESNACILIVHCIIPTYKTLGILMSYGWYYDESCIRDGPIVPTTTPPWIWPSNGKILRGALPKILNPTLLWRFSVHIYDYFSYFPMYEISSWANGLLIWFIVLWWWHISIMLWC